jgi:hypothetical protein
MTYVPVVSPPPPSPRARELGRRLEEVIQTFRAENPGLSDSEIRQALALVTKGLGKVSQVLVLTLALSLLLAGILAFFMVGRQGNFDDRSFILAMIAAVGIFLVILAAILRNR